MRGKLHLNHVFSTIHLHVLFFIIQVFLTTLKKTLVNERIYSIVNKYSDIGAVMVPARLGIESCEGI